MKPDTFTFTTFRYLQGNLKTPSGTLNSIRHNPMQHPSPTATTSTPSTTTAITTPYSIHHRDSYNPQPHGKHPFTIGQDSKLGTLRDEMEHAWNLPSAEMQSRTKRHGTSAASRIPQTGPTHLKPSPSAPWPRRGSRRRGHC